MKKMTVAGYKKYLLSGAMLIAMGAMPMVAHATPYAYGSNQITDLLISGVPAANIVSGTETISNFAAFGSFSDATGNSASINSALTAPQAYAGPGPAPAAVFTPDGPTFTGTRAYSNIGALTKTGVSVNNVAEGNGNSFGSSTASNTATIDFNVTGTGQALTVAFTDAVNLMASTSAGENATSTANDSFTLTNASGATIATYQPINQHLGSQNGSVANPYSLTAAYTFTTGVLALGQDYTLSLISQSTENIVPSIPEPGSLLLLGTGMLGLAVILRKKAKKR